jgi:hypothetical protein
MRKAACICPDAALYAKASIECFPPFGAASAANQMIRGLLPYSVEIRFFSFYHILSLLWSLTCAFLLFSVVNVLLGQVQAFSQGLSFWADNGNFAKSL